MTLLSVNVNKIALIRNSRGGTVPEVTRMAQIALDAGAHGITVHPRPDGRHIRTQDVYDLAKMLDVEFNIEGYPTDEFMKLVLDVRPAQVTLVPDEPGQLTSDHGWDIPSAKETLKPLIGELKNAGIRVSVFMDPVVDQIERVPEIGADRIELYTEDYARAYGNADHEAVLRRYADAAQTAERLSLGVNAGHDLDQKNLHEFCNRVPNVLEVSIGHALISEALEEGLRNTVKAYLRALGHE